MRHEQWSGVIEVEALALLFLIHLSTATHKSNAHNNYCRTDSSENESNGRYRVSGWTLCLHNGGGGGGGGGGVSVTQRL